MISRRDNRLMIPPEGHTPVEVCIHPDILRAFAGGQAMDEIEAARISSHLLSCDRCAVVVEQAPTDEFAGRLRTLHQHDSTSGRETHRLTGDYEILEELGRGGCGVVYKARQPGTGRLVALKRIKSGALADSDELLRFQREARALSALVHSNIVQVFDFGEQDGEPYLAMELIDGSSLAAYLAQGPLSPPVAAELVRRLAVAIDSAHLSGIVHRDLKPANILLQHSIVSPATAGLGEPKIVDFGLARTQAAQTGVTTPGIAIGTPAYMAPEQIDGSSSPAGPPADVYALGAILYECLTGRPPFSGLSHLETMRLAGSADLVPPRRLNPAVSKPLEAICLKALARNLQRRYASAADLAEDLRRFLADEPVSARSPGLGERLRRSIRRHPTFTITFLFGVLSIAGLLMHQTRLQAEINRANARTEEANKERQRVIGLFVEGRETMQQIHEEVMDLLKDKSPAAQALIDNHLRTTLGHAKRTVEAVPARDTYAQLAHAHRIAATVDLDRKDSSKALDHMNAAAEAMQEVIRRAPHDDGYAADAARIDVVRAQALFDLDRSEEGTPILKAALSDFRRIYTAHPDDKFFARDLEWAESIRNSVRWPDGDR